MHIEFLVEELSIEVVLNSLVPKYDIMTIAWGALPYLIPAMVLIALLTAFPQLVLWLPSIMY